MRVLYFFCVYAFIVVGFMENLWKWVCAVFAAFLELKLDFFYCVFFVGFLIGGIFEELVKMFLFFFYYCPRSIHLTHNLIIRQG